MQICQTKYFSIKAGLILVLLFYSTNLFSIVTEIEQIYYSKTLSDKDKFDSILVTFFQNKSPINQVINASRIVSLAELEKDNLWLFRGYYFKGNAYCYLAEAEKACRYYYKSLMAASKGNYSEVKYLVYYGLGNAFSISGDSKKAISNYKIAINLMDKDKDIVEKGYTLLNIVDEYQKINYTDSILYYLDFADSIFRVTSDPLGKSYVFGNKAILYAKNGDFVSAKIFLNESLKILSKVGSIYDILAFKIEMTKIFLKHKEIEAAHQMAHECYIQAKKESLKEQIRDASRLLSELYHLQANYKKAYQYQLEYLAYKDSINNEETIRNMADLRTEFEVSQKQVEIDQLQKRRETNKIILISTLIVVLVLTILIYFLVKYIRVIKKQRRTLIQQKQELQNLNATKDKMFSIVSHDLRGPIHSITSFSNVLKEMVLKKQTDMLIEMSDLMNSSLLNISSLLDNLLEWATNQQGQIPYHPEKFNIYEVMESLRDVFHNSAMAKGVSILIKLDENIWIEADKNTFTTIFRNLIGNAIKFTNKGDTITIGCLRENNLLKLYVSDTGIGIAKDKLSDLFNMNNQESTFGTSNEKGIGLGLRLVYEFTELNKGRVFVESQEGEGTTFYVEFPA